MRVLFVTGRPPWPVRRGDQARTAALAGGLSRRGHRVRIVAQRPPGVVSGGPPEGIPVTALSLTRRRILVSLALRPSLPGQVAWHWQPALRRAVAAEVAAFRPDVAVLVLSRLAWAAPALGDLPYVLDLVDSLALNMLRRAGRPGLLSPLWRLEARRMERWERAAIAAATASTVVAERDRKALVDAGAEPGRLSVVPLAVPLAIPRAIPGPSSGPARDPAPAILVSGNLGYFPTVDGLRWLAAEVWPRLRVGRPELELWIAGSRPAGAVARLAQEPGIRLFREPDDLDAIRAGAALAAVPLRSGSGTAMKALEAMAAGLPVVATPAAVEGLDGLPDEAVAVGAGAAAFADAALALLAEPRRAERQAATARAWLVGRHDPERVTSSFEAILAAAAEGKRGA